MRRFFIYFDSSGLASFDFVNYFKKILEKRSFQKKFVGKWIVHNLLITPDLFKIFKDIIWRASLSGLLVPNNDLKL